jgi:hypothetical protein
MELYREQYFKLFAAIADAVEELENGEPILAKNTLVDAMKAAEERFLTAGGDERSNCL